MKKICWVIAAILLGIFSQNVLAANVPTCEELVKDIPSPREGKYTIGQKPTCEGNGVSQTVVYESIFKSTNNSPFETEKDRQSQVEGFKPAALVGICDSNEFRELLKYLKVKFIVSFQTSPKKYYVGTYDNAVCKKAIEKGADVQPLPKTNMDLELCSITADVLNKKLPAKIDDSTTRMSVNCMRGFTKETALVLNDDIKSNKSPKEFEAFLLTNKDAIKKDLCSTATFKTMVKARDIIVSYSVNGYKVGDIPVAEKDCIK